MSDRYMTEKKTQLQYRINKFKKEHNYIPDLNKDPSGRTGTVVGDDGERINFQFNGGTTKKSKVARYNDDGAYYDVTNRKIHMSNSNFNTPVKGAENITFNHEYGHHKYDMKPMDIEYWKTERKAVEYGSENKKYKDIHDKDTEEVLADVNSIIHTKNGNKVYKKHYQDLGKGRHKLIKGIQQNLNYQKRNMEKDILRRKRSLSPHETDKIRSLDDQLENLDNNYDYYTTLYNKDKNTDYYRAKSNLKAAKDPVLRNYMQ